MPSLFARLRMTSTSYVSASALHSIHHRIKQLPQGYSGFYICYALQEEVFLHFLMLLGGVVATFFTTALQAHMASPERGSHESGNLWGRHCMAPGYFSLTLCTSNIANICELSH